MVDAIPPMPFVWNGEAMVPKRPRIADHHFVIGEEYELVEQHARSQASHNHFFAAVHDAWANLPDDAAIRFPSADHLRKYALINTGYRDERTTVCASHAEALRFAAFCRPLDEYAIVSASEAVVRVWTAKSQSTRAMGKQRFQESKDAVLGFLAQMIGVEPAQLGHASA